MAILVAGKFVSHLAQTLVNLFLQLSYAALPGVVLDDELEGILVETYLWRNLVESGAFQLFRYEVALGNLCLLFGAGR